MDFAVGGEPKGRVVVSWHMRDLSENDSLTGLSLSSSWTGEYPS